MGPMRLYRLLQVKNMDSTAAHTGFYVNLKQDANKTDLLVGTELWHSTICLGKTKQNNPFLQQDMNTISGLKD